MAVDIRKESGVMLIQQEGFHMLDLENLLKEHPRLTCRQLQAPDIVLWDDSIMYVVEAKASLSRKTAPSDDLQNLADTEKFALVSPLEVNERELCGKFLSALACMGEEGKRAFLKCPDAMSDYVDDVEAFKKLRLSDMPRILLVILLPDIPDEYMPMKQNELEIDLKSVMAKVHAILPQCDFRLFNANEAAKLKLARKL